MLQSVIHRSCEIGGDLGVMEMTLEYGGNRPHACEIVDFEDGKIKGLGRILPSTSKRQSGGSSGRKDVEPSPYSPNVHKGWSRKFVYAARAQSTPVEIRMAFRLPGR